MVNLQYDNTPDVSRAYSSPGEDADVTSTAPPAYDSEQKDSSSREDKAPSVTSATTAVTHAAKLTYDELKAQLEKAEAQIAALRDSGGLRKLSAKGVDGEKPKAAELATAVRETVDGVPVQIVAGLCFLSFLLAYLFF